MKLPTITNQESEGNWGRQRVQVDPLRKIKRGREEGIREKGKTGTPEVEFLK